MKTSNLHIKKISSQETFPVRHPVLRAGRPLKDCVFEGDNLKTTIHFGLFENKQLLGVASFFKKNHFFFKETTQFQLRGMAILKDFQGKGLGQILLEFGENELKKQNIHYIWCNARIIAVPFYEKQGYQKKGVPFDIKGIGDHYVMFKKI